MNKNDKLEKSVKTKKPLSNTSNLKAKSTNLKEKNQPLKQEVNKAQVVGANKSLDTTSKKIADPKLDLLTAEVEKLQQQIASASAKTSAVLQKKLTAAKKKRERILTSHSRKNDMRTMRKIKSINSYNKHRKAQLSRKHGKNILQGKIVSLNNNTPNVKENVIELFNVHKWYYSGSVAVEALKGISFTIQDGNFVCVLGPSGSGKTTLLNIISGLDVAEEGDIFVNGYNLSLLNDRYLTLFRRNNVSFIFQRYNLLPNLTVYENVEVGANLAGKKVKRDEIVDLLDTIGIKSEMDKFPFQLSGGQQQRVSIARALAKKPRIMFCDEPTGALDEVTGKVVLDVLLKVNKTFKTTIVFVTHNQNIAAIANNIIKFHDGKVDSFEKNPNPLTSAQNITWV